MMKTAILADGSRRAFDCATAAEVAASIAPSLAKRAVACRINGVVRDIAAPFADGDNLEFISRDDDDALELIRHDCAHIMAQAVLQLFPDARPTIGPVIDDGFYYDFDRAQPFSADDLELIEKRMRAIVAQKIPLHREEWTREQALAHYQNQPYKAELVRAIPAGEVISFYRQGDFLDLCRGPHLRHTGDAGTAFKLMRVAGSYWRGDSNNRQLQRIYGTAFCNEPQLRDYLTMRAEAEARDHRRLGRAMGLFHQQEEAAGMVFWHDKGWRLYRLLESYMRRKLEGAGYAEVKTPQLVERKLWMDSGHWHKFRQNMYIAESEDGLRDYAERPDDARIFALKPMNCPCHVQIYKQGVKSYRDLPLRMAEFGSCHRAEPSGALHGLLRARHFVQDDAHIFCTEEQVAAETAAFMELLRGIYRDLGFAEFAVKFADRPAERAGDDSVWDRAESALRDACASAKVQWQLNPGEGAFYGPKLEFVLKDAIGREWQCGTWQVDFVLPERLGAEYTDADGERKRPVMCHRAIIGSFERFIGILLEHHNGHLPLWLAPVQVVAATITDAANDYANEVVNALRAAGLRCEVDSRNEKINYKVREHSAAKVPVILALGEREAGQKAVSIRRLGSRQTIAKPLADAVEELRREAQQPA